MRYRAAEMTTSRPADLRSIFPLWLPMALTWVMMALEGPFLAAVIARLPEPKIQLAAFGVAFACAIIIESPVIMVLSASTALIVGPGSFRRLQRFTLALNIGVTAAMLVLLLTPAFGWFAREWLALPDDVAAGTRKALLILLPWPAAIGYRRFLQGLLIRTGETRRVAYGTMTRLSAMSITGAVTALATPLPGAAIGAAALAAGVSAEAGATRWMARRAVRRFRDEPASAAAAAAAPDARGSDRLTYAGILRFYLPLALTSTIGLAAHPMVTFFMGQAARPLDSLAVLPVIHSLTFLFRSAGLSFQEVAIALLGESDANQPGVLRFAGGLALAASAGLGLIAFTPLCDVWFGTISGLDAELTRFARLPVRILSALPALSVLLALQRALLVHARRTASITWATAAELAGIGLLLFVTIRFFGAPGAVAAAVAMLGGRALGNTVLLPALRSRIHST